MKLSTIYAALALPAAMIMSAPSNAAVTYSFVGAGDITGTTFTFERPNYVSGGQTVSAFTARSDGFNDVSFCSEGVFSSGCIFSSPGLSYLGFNHSFGSFYVYYNGSPFQSDGVFASTEGSAFPGLLTIVSTPDIDVPPTPAVPEPSTWAMLLLGFGMVAGVARYRTRSNNIVYT